MKLSDDLNQVSLIVKMKEYLNSKGYENLHNFAHQEVCSLDILQAMMQAYLISPKNLSLLKEMMEFCSRNDLLQRIDEFNNKKGLCIFVSVYHAVPAYN